MFRGQDLYYRETIRIWFILAFQAGAINIGGFLACHRFVTHVTGFPTLFARDVAMGETTAAVNIMLVPIFFVIGAMVSGWLVDRKIERQRTPQYSTVFALVCLLLLLVIALGKFGYFGFFGEVLHNKRDYILMGILCAASGLQNAVITTASGYRVRTTHLTGISTDFGIGLVKIFTNRKDKSLFKNEVLLNFYRFGTIASFIIGGVVGAFAYTSLDYVGFAVPLATALFLWKDSISRQRIMEKKAA